MTNENAGPELDRRDALKAIGATVLGSQAGCMGGGTGNGSESGTDQAAEETPGGEVTGEPGGGGESGGTQDGAEVSTEGPPQMSMQDAVRMTPPFSIETGRDQNIARIYNPMQDSSQFGDRSENLQQRLVYGLLNQYDETHLARADHGQADHFITVAVPDDLENVASVLDKGNENAEVNFDEGNYFSGVLEDSYGVQDREQEFEGALMPASESEVLELDDGTLVMTAASTWLDNGTFPDREYREAVDKLLEYHRGEAQTPIDQMEFEDEAVSRSADKLFRTVTGNNSELSYIPDVVTMQIGDIWRGGDHDVRSDVVSYDDNTGSELGFTYNGEEVQIDRTDFTPQGPQIKALNPGN